MAPTDSVAESTERGEPHSKATMPSKSATFSLAIGCATVCAPAIADPSICVGALTDIEVLFHVKQDAYFIQHPLDGKSLRVEYDGCDYRVHVGEIAQRSKDGDLLLVDRCGHVKRVVHLR